MTDRRTFLKQSLATMSALSLPGASFAFEPGKAGFTSSPFRYVVVDPNIAESVRFGAVSQQLGARVFEASGSELGDMWYEGLREDLRENPGLVGGLTDQTSSFLIRTLSHDIWHYTMLNNEHVIRGNVVEHRFESFGKELSAESLSTIGSTDWPAALAQDLHLAAWKDLEPQARKPVKPQPGDTVRLESWVIGPMHARKPAQA